ncbi:hypothetical protein LCGC14_1416940, partial [marine sediment metagenome]
AGTTPSPNCPYISPIRFIAERTDNNNKMTIEKITVIRTRVITPGLTAEIKSKSLS